MLCFYIFEDEDVSVLLVLILIHQVLNTNKIKPIQYLLELLPLNIFI